LLTGRLDTLAVIVISYYFPFYEYLPHAESRPDPNFVRALRSGFNAWQANGVTRLDVNNAQVPTYLRREVAYVLQVYTGTDDLPHYPHQLLRRETSGYYAPQAPGRWKCTCDGFTQTNHQCEHLWASSIYINHGAIDAFDAAVHASQVPLPANTPRTETGDDQVTVGNDHQSSVANEGEWDDDLRNSKTYGAADPQQSIVNEDVDNLREEGENDGSDNDNDDDYLDNDIPLGHEDSVQPPDDQADLEAYWKTDIMATGDLSDLETITIATGTWNSSRRNKPGPYSQLDPSEPSDAISSTESGTFSTDSENDRQDEHTAALKNPNQSGNPPGPSATNRPLNPRRNKGNKGSKTKKDPKKSKRTGGQKSSLGLGERVKNDIVTPAGIQNTGNDCYGAALLQILARQPQWSATLNYALSNNQSLADSDIGKTLRDIVKSVNDNVTKSFPMLNKTFAAAIGQSAGQHDPAELLRGLNQFFDQHITEGARSFDRLFGMSVRNSYACPRCSERTNERDDYTEIIANAPSSTTGVWDTTPAMIVRGLSMKDSVASRQCSNNHCGKTFLSGLDTAIKLDGQLLAIEVSSRADSVGALCSSGQTFDLTNDMVFGNDEWSDLLDEGNIHWKLRGVICYTEGRAKQGHYTSIFLEDKIWWEANDSHVKQLKSVLHAFKALRTPRVLFYSRVQGRREDGKGGTDGQPKANSKGEGTAKGDGTSRRTPNKRKRPANEDQNSETASDDANNTEPPLKKTNVSRSATWDVDNPSDGNQTPQEHNMDPLSLPHRPRPLGFEDPPRFVLDIPNGKERTPLDPWHYRYVQINWPRRQRVPSRLNVLQEEYQTVGLAEFVEAKQYFPARPPVGVDDIKALVEPDGWPGTELLNKFATIFEELRLSVRKKGSEWSVYGGQLFVRTIDHLGGTTLDRCTAHAGPAPFFAEHPNWRSKRTVHYLNVSNNTHWMTVIVFGPERLVVPYDSLGGRSMDTELRKVSDHSVCVHRVAYVSRTESPDLEQPTGSALGVRVANGLGHTR
jgi:hypothetical protein